MSIEDVLKPYFVATGMQPVIRNGVPLLVNDMLGLKCKVGHEFMYNINKINLAGCHVECPVCSQPNGHATAREYAERKLGPLRMVQAGKGVVYVAGDITVGIGDQLAPIPWPRLLLPDTADEVQLEQAWKQYEYEVKIREANGAN